MAARDRDLPNAAKSGRFSIGGREVNRLGFGAMRVTGPGIWGEPADRAEAIRTLKRLPELGINFVDTADAYGPNISEELIGETLAPYGDMLVATKGGLLRTGPDKWIPLGRPDYLIQQAHASAHRLRVEQIALWQLHRIDPDIPRDEQFGAIKSLLDDGVIAAAGLSQASIEEIEAASKLFPVATVQNRYNLIDRSSDDVWSTAPSAASASSRGIRSRRAIWPGRARCSTAWPGRMARRRARSRSPGC